MAGRRALGPPVRQGAVSVASIAHALEQRLGYAFRDAALLDEALTHVSAGEGGRSYQRLEFLGDRVLGLVVASRLHEAFPAATEGELSKRLAELVRKETCAAVARDWDLGAFLKMGIGEKRSGARQREAILGDACEAVIGAVYCDGGLEPATALIRRFWDARLRESVEVPKDPKTVLQEAVQARGLPVPVYADRERSGPDHAPRFVVAVAVAGFAEAKGEGRSKRLAERAAAEAFLKREGLA